MCKGKTEKNLIYFLDFSEQAKASQIKQVTIAYGWLQHQWLNSTEIGKQIRGKISIAELEMRKKSGK